MKKSISRKQVGYSRVILILLFPVVFFMMGMGFYLGGLNTNFFQKTNLDKIASTPVPSASDLADPKLCAQVITPAKNLQTGECKDFPTPCDVPSGWEKVDRCGDNQIDGLKSYSNKNLGIEFKYPAKVGIKEENSSVELNIPMGRPYEPVVIRFAKGRDYYNFNLKGSVFPNCQKVDGNEYEYKIRPCWAKKKVANELADALEYNPNSELAVYYYISSIDLELQIGDIYRGKEEALIIINSLKLMK